MKVQFVILAGMAALTSAVLCRSGSDVSKSEDLPEKSATAAKLSEKSVTLQDPVLPLPAVEPENPVLARLREQAELAARNASGETRAWEALVDSFTARNVPLILDELANAQGEALADLRHFLVRRWAAANPAAAGVWAAELSDPVVQKDALEQVALVWYQRNPAEALAWAVKIPVSDGSTAAMTALGYEFSRVNPVAALDIAGTLPAGQERDALVQYAALQWSATSPAEVVAWADQVEDPLLRERVLANAATVWSDIDPVSAARLAVFMISPGKPQDDAIIGIVQRWVQKDPEAAAKWVAAFPEGSLGETAMENVIRLRAGQ